MTKNEIIEMARQAGINYRDLSDEFATGNGDGVEIEQMEAFAKLVAAKEREKLVYLLVRLANSYEFADKQGSAQDIRVLIDHICEKDKQ